MIERFKVTVTAFDSDIDLASIVSTDMVDAAERAVKKGEKRWADILKNTPEHEPTLSAAERQV